MSIVRSWPRFTWRPTRWRIANTLPTCNYMLSEDGLSIAGTCCCARFGSRGSVPFCAIGQWHGGVHMACVGEFGGDVNGV